MARVRAGDTRAFDEIYDRYARSIHSFCRHLLGQPDDAEDAVQHAFLAAYRSIQHSAQPIDLKPWLFAIARNRCVSLLRARRRDPAAGGEEAAPEPATEGLLAAVERRESLRDLLRDIGSLPEDQRSALILTQLGTLRHEHVAHVLGVPTEKVKALVFQARNSLISARLARDTACQDIRQQLATLTGGALRRGNLRRHLVSCSGCRDYQLALKRQRVAIVVLLPVVAQPLLRQKVLGEIAGGAGGGGAGTGAGGALGGLAAKGVATKVGLAMTVAATGVGVATLTGNVHRAFGDPDPPRAAEAAAGHVSVRASAPTTSIHPSAALRQPSGSAQRLIRVRTPPRSRSTPTHHPGPTASAPATQHSESAAPSPSGTPLTPSQTLPGHTEQGAAPPGLTKKGGVPPGQAKKNSSRIPPGQVKKNGTHVPPGQAKKNAPAATTAPTTTPEPVASPPGNGNGNGNGDGHGNAGANGNAGGNGKGKGH